MHEHRHPRPKTLNPLRCAARQPRSALRGGAREYPITLMDLDDLADAVAEYHEKMHPEAKRSYR